LARLLEEMAAEIGMELAVRLERVEPETVSRLLEGLRRPRWRRWRRASTRSPSGTRGRGGPS